MQDLIVPHVRYHNYKQLIMFRKIVGNYFGNCTKHVTALFEKNAVIFKVAYGRWYI